MSEYGFYIEEVRLTGQGVAEAMVDFDDGLNVIAGASNTGKTYIAQCIDFAFGRKDVPKEIPEARRYDQVSVRIRPRGKRESLTITRSLQGGNSITVSDGHDDRIVKAIHSDDTDDNISAVLLELCGLRNKRVILNARGRTRSVSFRDLSHLVLINEEQIIRSDSPILTKVYTENTVRQRVFRLLLTCTDDSSVIEQKEVKVSKAENRGKGVVLEELESDIQEKIDAFGNAASADELRLQRDRLGRTIQEMSGFLQEQRSNLAAVESDRRSVWTELQRIESRQEVVDQLLVRFLLLSKQYESDLNRLASISEVGSRLGELKEERCPVCGAIAEHHSEEHAKNESSPESIALAAAAETSKVQQLSLDLEKTIRETRDEGETLAKSRGGLEASLSQITQRLNDQYQPQVANSLQQYQTLLDQRSSLDKLIEYYSRLEHIETIRTEANATLAVETSGEPIPAKVTSDVAAPFCTEVERLLNDWQLPDRGRVSFSEDTQDIVIGDRRREVDGKGVRAITHAAFSLALNNFCIEEKLPTTSFVVLDSPLVVYREPDETEADFSLDVKANFYRQLADGSADRQVIVFENDEPPEGLESSANVVHFTKSDEGRYGFIPRSDVALDEEE